mmetsp:Transcript_21170/g.43329  ORF Transcript_21170/g.43329 Transcript_21170/m.43329 type:complete len:89 (-) Transcript_21170:183-449(-)
MKLQSIKMEMSKAIVNSDNSTMYSMGTDRLLDLFTFEERDGDVINSKCIEGKSKHNLLHDVSSQEGEYATLSAQGFLQDLFSSMHSAS